MSAASPDPAAAAEVARLLTEAARPVIVGGRGALDAGPQLAALAERTGALLATSAVANGLFAGHPRCIGISGGFATPQAAELLPQADVVLAAGASLNHWTTRHGALIGPDATVVGIDPEPAALGRHQRLDLGLVADARLAADAILAALPPAAAGTSAAATTPGAADTPPAANTPGAAARAAGWPPLEIEPWNAVPYEEADGLDPRTFSIELDRRLPADRLVTVDSGHFTGWPAMHVGVQAAGDWCFVNAFQAVGLGLGVAIGAAVAHPDRVTVCAVGDGGAFLGLPELETVARLRLKLLIAVYDDEAYGAEIHHFGPLGHDTRIARFPPADLAAIARGAGLQAHTIRAVDDLAVLDAWLAAGADGPLLLDAKVDPSVAADWLAEAFRTG